jgi:hypothetical protein
LDPLVVELLEITEMNWKGSGRKRLWLNRGTVPAFPWVSEELKEIHCSQ